MKISDKGVQLIKDFEGLRLEAYKCPSDVWTIGYGHTKTAKPGQKIAEAQAEALLRDYDLPYFERSVSAMIKVPVRQGQFDALVSFAYNLGADALRRSTLLRKLNRNDDYGAAEEFLKWNKAGGKVLPGLTRRRKAEREMFLG